MQAKGMAISLRLAVSLNEIASGVALAMTFGPRGALLRRLAKPLK